VADLVFKGMGLISQVFRGPPGSLKATWPWATPLDDRRHLAQRAADVPADRLGSVALALATT
jgi:hypothetical protein